MNNEQTTEYLRVVTGTGLISLQQGGELYRQHTTHGRILDFGETLNSLGGTLVEFSGIGTAVVSASQAVTNLSLLSDLSRQLENISQSLEPGVEDPFRVAEAPLEAAFAQAVRVERSVGNIFLKKFMRVLPDSVRRNENVRDRLRRINGRLSNVIGLDGEKAVAFVLSSLVGADGQPLFNDVRVGVGIGRGGVDVAAVTRSDRLIPIEVKVSGDDRYRTVETGTALAAQSKGATAFTRARLNDIIARSSDAGLKEFAGEYVNEPRFRGYYVGVRNHFDVRKTRLTATILNWDANINESIREANRALARRDR